MDYDKILSDLQIRYKSHANLCKNISKNRELVSWLRSNVNFEASSISELLYLYNNKTFNPYCKRGKKRKFHQGKYLIGCGGKCECSIESTKNTNIQKYGVENPIKNPQIREKTKKTNLERYGVDSPLKSSEIKDKIKKTNLKKYGTQWALQSPKIQDKISKSNLKKYGVNRPAQLSSILNKMQQTSFEHWGHANPSSSKIIKEKRKSTFKERYDVHNPFQLEFVKEKSKQTNIKKYGSDFFKQKHIPKDQLEILHNQSCFIQTVKDKKMFEIKQRLNVDYSTIMFYANKYGCVDLIEKSSSNLEDQIQKLCDMENIEYIKNARKIIPPLELDFYFPQANAAVECHGLYWHSEISNGKTKEYHWNKWRVCRETGIYLYQYFEDEINNCFDVIKSKILYLNKKHRGDIIGARKLTIDFLKNYSDESTFYQTNHIQGPRPDRTHAIGAWLDSFNLVAVMSVKQSKPNQMEIVRFATDINNRYPGVFSKMLNWYVQKSSFHGDIFSWSDNRHSNGHLYKSNGFKPIKEQGPGYFVTDYCSRWRREHFMKKRIKQYHPEVDLTKTEWQLEQQLGLDRIWDAGKILWKKSL